MTHNHDEIGGPVPDAPHEVLSRPLTLRCGVTLPNRIAKAAMTEGLADRDQQPTAALERLYRAWAEGGSGLVITGNAMVDRRSLERARNVVVDAAVDPTRLRRWAAAASGTPTIVQLSHAGRQTNRTVAWRPVSASEGDAVSLLGAFGRPRALSLAEVEDVRDRFIEAGVRTVEAGFAGVQVHGAHGYLLSQFLSPATNRRTDRYGGGAAGRARLLLEVVEQLRARLPDHAVLAVKVNSKDFLRGGLEEDEAAATVRRLDAAGVDVVELSGGTYEQVAFIGGTGDDEEAYFLSFARSVRRDVEVPLMVTGGWTDVASMAAAVEAGEADLIGLGRPLAAEPDLAARLLSGRATAAPRPAPSLGGVLQDPSEVGWYRLQMELTARGRAPWTGAPAAVAGADYVLRDLVTSLADGVHRRRRAAAVESERGA